MRVALPSSKVSMAKILPPEMLGLIGSHIDTLASVNMFHRVVALRNNTAPRTTAQVRKFASIMSMMSQRIVEGNLYQMPMIQPDYTPNKHSHQSDALVFYAVEKTSNMAKKDRTSLLRSIVKRFPQATMLHNRDRYTPIHVAVQDRNTLYEIAPFLEEYPALVNVDRLLLTDGVQETPLFTAIGCQAPYETIAKMIDVERKVLTMQNEAGCTPLHGLFDTCSNFLTAASVRLLSFPDSPVRNNALLMLVDEKNETPLHVALKVDTDTTTAHVHHLKRIDFAEIVGLLVDTHQDVLEHKNRAIVELEDEFADDSMESNTPLHLAVQRRMPWTILQLLIDQHQHVLLLRNSVDRRGNNQFATPLHIAIELALPPDAITGLIDDGARVLVLRNNFNDMPLHAALRKQRLRQRNSSFNEASQKEIVKMLIRRGVEAHVDFLTFTGHGGDTVLHIAVKHEAPLCVVRMLVNADDRSLLIPNSFGEYGVDTPENQENDTPLHSALENQASDRVLRLLVDVDETVLFMANAAGETPLHIAARLDKEVGIIALLIPERNPPAHLPDVPFDVLLTKNNQGNTPLHLALLADAGFEVIQLLIDRDREVLYATNDTSQIPLHVAAENNASLETMAMLMTTGPGALDVRLEVDINDWTPLHTALCHKVSIEIVRLLIDPECIVLGMLTTDLETPLHIAASDWNKHSPLTWTELLRPSPEPHEDARILQDIRGNTPCHRACYQEASFEVLKLLIDPAKVALNTINDRMMLPVHSGVWLGFERVQLLLDVTAYTTKWPLRFMPDSDGNTPLHIALNSCNTSEKTVFEVVQLLIDDEELVLGALNESDMTPLHVATLNVEWELMLPGDCRKLLHLLLGSRPFATGGFPLAAIPLDERLQMRDCHEDSPLQNAVASHLPYELLPMLIDTHKNLLLVKKDVWNAQQQTRLVYSLLPLNDMLRQWGSRGAWTPSPTIVPFFIDPKQMVLWSLDDRSHLPLHNAIAFELDIQIIQQLLPPVATDGKKPDVGKHIFLGAPGYTPLQLAVRHKTDIAVYRLLLAHFSGPGYRTLICRDNNDDTALMSAVRLGHCTEIMKLLIDPARDVLLLSSPMQLTPLHVALEKDLSVAHIQLLMDGRKRVLMCRDTNLNTPLHAAFLNGDSDVAVLYALLERTDCSAESIQESLMMTDSLDRTPLNLAVLAYPSWKRRYMENEWWGLIVHLASMCPGALMVPCSRGKTPLLNAIHLGRSVGNFFDLTKLIDLDKTVLSVAGSDGVFPLHVMLKTASWDSHAPYTIDALRPVLHPRILTLTDRHGMTALHVALMYEYTDNNVLAGLIDAQREVLLIQDKDGRTPLHIACELKIDNVDTISLLLDAVDRVQLCRRKTKQEYTPLVSALYSGASFRVIQCLLAPLTTRAQKKSILLTKDNIDHTPLHCAIYQHASVNILRLLLDPQCDVLTSMNAHGRSPLHVAIEMGVLPLDDLAFLIDPTRTVLTMQDVDGNTPLHLAMLSIPVGATAEYAETVERMLVDFLLQVLEYKNAAGRTPLETLQYCMDNTELHLHNDGQRAIVQRLLQLQTPA